VTPGEALTLDRRALLLLRKPQVAVLNVGMHFSNKHGVRLNLGRMDRFIPMIMLVASPACFQATRPPAAKPAR
jgi:hypothetical protein